jgi:hypothetical protein
MRRPSRGAACPAPYNREPSPTRSLADLVASRTFTPGFHAAAIAPLLRDMPVREGRWLVRTPPETQWILGHRFRF